MARRRSGKPTMTDVAAAAGCSQSTVSIVLRGTTGHRIPDNTRRRVAEAAVALGYAPPSATVPGREPSRRSQPPSAVLLPERAGPPSFTDRVARSVAINILSGRQPEGSTLPSDASLMAEFGVSRTVLREAIRLLSGKGLLEARARVGTRVRQRARWHLFDPDVLIWQAEAGLDRVFVEHLGEMRLILEPEAAALAARRSSADAASRLVGLADRMAAAGISAEAFTRADLDFHLAVSACAGNPFLSAVSALIEVSLTASLRRSWPGDDPGGVARSAAAHRCIAEAIGAGDGETARSAMREVINQGMARSLRR